MVVQEVAGTAQGVLDVVLRVAGERAEFLEPAPDARHEPADDLAAAAVQSLAGPSQPLRRLGLELAGLGFQLGELGPNPGFQDVDELAALGHHAFEVVPVAFKYLAWNLLRSLFVLFEYALDAAHEPVDNEVADLNHHRG